MKTPFRITGATLDVLEVLLSAEELHGFAVAKAAGKPTGSVYPILLRLEEAGWVESRWETEHPDAGRPRRRFYQLTADGMASARAIIKERRGPTPATRRTGLGPALGFVRRLGGAW
ncbi:PadR family transcriptional regulator [Streptomyces sp. SP18BB07]|uniref:PadR family transcriptional regulator n=1 Tax=Streptomyces sp. SP18BB07 TaxID=3002522 RepID=UPI002E761A4F|nr:PadR family transcriptional regulator [Streptomyces sp. SP18BB07]MEE1761189.1 PadR family transcriptional regulator [Streptomyces sp. SP18BB07]